MITPDMDQQIAATSELTATLWYALYQASLRVGFNETHAFSLVQTYILSQNPNGIRPQDTRGPQSND